MLLSTDNEDQEDDLEFCILRRQKINCLQKRNGSHYSIDKIKHYPNAKEM